MEFLEANLIYLVPLMGVLGLFVMFVKSRWVSIQDPGDEKMVSLSNHIAKGAMAFLVAEWRVLTIFSIIAAGLLAWSGTLVETSSPLLLFLLLLGRFSLLLQDISE